jgi:ribosomal protein S18 acetylase RimI-like enzyme
MKIRPANDDDLNSLTAITHRCIENLNKQGIYQWDEIYPSKKDFYDDILDQSLYVITAAKKILGCICINQIEHPGYENADWLGSRFLVVHKMIIDPQEEKQGCGKFAMNYSEKVARSKKKDSIRLDCFKENLRANQFYQKLGYIVRGETLFRKGMFNLYEKMIGSSPKELMIFKGFKGSRVQGFE